MTFWDGEEKVYTFSPPHSWVGIAVNGRGTILDRQFVEDFVATLPPIRLKVEDYASRLLQFSLSFLADFPMPESVDILGDRTNIAVGGYDPDAIRASLCMVTPERNHMFDPFSGTTQRFIFGGETQYVNQATRAYLDQLAKELVNKSRAVRTLGLPLSPNEVRLIDAFRSRRSDLIQKNLSKKQAIQFANSIIEFVGSELVRNEQPPSVGGGVDLLWISATEGATFVQKSDEEPGHVLADANCNQIELDCCKVRFQFHLPVNAGESRPGYLSELPEDGVFKCKKCGTEADLVELVDMVRDDLGMPHVRDGDND